MRVFDAEIVKEKNLTYAQVPFNAKEEFGIEKGPLLVRGEANGHPYRTRLIPKGSGKQILVLSKELQKRIGLTEGTLHLTMEPDMEKEGEAQRPYLPEQSGMDVISAITERRSIRKYVRRTIDDNIINTIIYAGLCAPSAKDKRPWHFIVIRDEGMLIKIASAGQYTGMIAQAPLCIAVCGDRNVEGTAEFLYQDCGAAAQNMLLCAHALGLGAVWCGVPANSSQQKALISILDLPVKVMPIALIAAGYPDERKEFMCGFESSKVHHESW
jgi:nitroreductase